MRLQSGLTQIELAKQVQISQSALTKIERGVIDPSYVIMTRLIDVLESTLSSNRETLTLGQIMQRTIVSAHSSTPIRKLIQIFEKHHVSQLPIIDEGRAIGIVNERLLLGNIMDKGVTESQTAADVMGDPPAIVPLTTSTSSVCSLLKEHDIVLISEKGKIVGIISRSDVFERVV
jgi:predicted transcriptional regulator